jgi:hypothetical protein
MKKVCPGIFRDRHRRIRQISETNYLTIIAVDNGRYGCLTFLDEVCKQKSTARMLWLWKEVNREDRAVESCEITSLEL